MTPAEMYASKRKLVVPDMPSVSRRGANAVAAVGRVVTQMLLQGPVLVPAVEVQRRLAICQACEWWRTEAYGGTGGCGHEQCGCSRMKMLLTTERCPMGKWLVQGPDLAE
jgi:hypothetical protein